VRSGLDDNESDNKYKYIGCRNGRNLLPEQSRIAVKQPVCPAATYVFVFIVTFVIIKIVGLFIPLRASEEEESLNLLPEQSRIAVKQPVCPSVIDGSGGE
jgi:ammonia channel protein AmtB